METHSGRFVGFVGRLAQIQSILMRAAMELSFIWSRDPLALDAMPSYCIPEDPGMKPRSPSGMEYGTRYDIKTHCPVLITHFDIKLSHTYCKIALSVQK